MTGPSLWLLSSPRGGVTSVTVSGSTIEPVGSIIFLSAPALQYCADPKRQAKASMNLTMISAISLFAVWIILVAVAQLGDGPVHLLYATAMVLVARRIVAGAPKFLS